MECKLFNYYLLFEYHQVAVYYLYQLTVTTFLAPFCLYIVIGISGGSDFFTDVKIEISRTFQILWTSSGNVRKSFQRPLKTSKKFQLKTMSFARMFQLHFWLHFFKISNVFTLLDIKFSWFVVQSRVLCWYKELEMADLADNRKVHRKFLEGHKNFIKN